MSADVYVTPWDQLEGAGKPPICDTADMPGHGIVDQAGKRKKRRAEFMVHRADGRVLACVCAACRDDVVRIYGGTT